jgi:hypothetical protein
VTGGPGAGHVVHDDGDQVVLGHRGAEGEVVEHFAQPEPAKVFPFPNYRSKSWKPTEWSMASAKASMKPPDTWTGTWTEPEAVIP